MTIEYLHAGQVRARQTVRLGIRTVELVRREGDAVRRGEFLFRVSPIRSEFAALPAVGRGDADGGETVLAGEFKTEANGNAELGRLPIAATEPCLLLMSWTSAEGTGGNHYLLGGRPFDLERYRGWLGALAELDGGFEAAQVGC